MNIGQRIRQRRKEISMPVEELANKLGKNRATIYRYEKGDIENLPIDVLEPLAKALETTPQYLMGWDEIYPRYDKDKIKSLVDEDELTIGQMIRTIRRSRNLSIKDVSIKTGIPIEDLQKYEEGNKPLSANSLRSIGSLFGNEILDIADLLFGRTSLSKMNPPLESEYIKQVRQWYEEFGFIIFTDEERRKIFEYARFLLSQRETK